MDRVDVNARLLPPLHPLDLRLAEVRRHPELAVLGQRHQLLPGLHAIADVDRSLADDPVQRRDHLRVAKVQLRLPELRARQLEVRLPHRQAGLAGDQLAGSIGARLHQPGLRRLQPCPPLVHPFLR